MDAAAVIPRAAVLLLCAQPAVSHGHMTLPATRTATSVAASGTCAFDRCMWYTNNITIRGAPTNTDPAMLTMRVVPGSKDDIYATHPWRAPGTAPARSPCGANGLNHAARYGVDGRDLPRTDPALRPRWARGTAVDVAFALTANHGGGYQYRLCASEREQTEACFEATPLEFASNMTWVQVADRTETRVAAQAVRLDVGTVPNGSTWARNPIPNEPDWQEWPPPGGYAWGHQNTPFNIFDRVKIPADLPEGTYTLSWRWDCEQTAQVWSNCADVEVVSAAEKSDKVSEDRTRAPPTPLPAAQLVWKWSEARAGISGGAVFTSNGSVAFGTFLSTGSASPGTNRTFWALDRVTGEARWSVEVPTAVLYSGVAGDGVNGKDGVLYFGTLGPWVYAVRADTGAVLWRSGGGIPAEYTEPADDYFSAPALLNDTLYIGNYDTHLYALDTRTGATRWRFAAGGPCNGSPAVDAARGVVAFVTRSDVLTVLDGATGAVVWQVRTSSMLSSPAIHGDAILAGTLNGTAVAFDITSGRRLWTVGSGYGFGAVWALSGPPVAGGVVYLGCDDGKMYALDVRSGDILWTFQTGAPVQSAPVVAAGVLYFGSLDYRVYALNATTGVGLWSYATGLYVSSVPAVGADGTVYVGSYDGSFYALRAPAGGTTI